MATGVTGVTKAEASCGRNKLADSATKTGAKEARSFLPRLLFRKFASKLRLQVAVAEDWPRSGAKTPSKEAEAELAKLQSRDPPLPQGDVRKLGVPQALPVPAPVEIRSHIVSRKPRSPRRGQVVDMPGMGQVYVMEEDGAKWALVMKLSRNDFCHGSPRWTDGQAFNPHKMLDDSLPNIQEYDAKSIAFHKLQGVTAIRLQTGTGTSEVHFERSDTPEKLITTNDAKMSKHGGFNTWNYWNSWKSTFGSDRNGNPAFMRADKFVADPSPECRTNPEAGPLGCGQKCVFCMQAGDGSGCPVAPGAPHPNDVSSGIGLSVEFCGGGRAGDCSTGGHWSGQHRTLVWAKFSGSHRIFKMDISGVGQVYAKKDDGGAMWALVMKLSKNDFCHGSPRWTDGQAFNPHKMLDGSMPNIQEYDAKSIAFHRLKGVTAIRLETSTGTSEVHFERSDTPEKLITTNNAKMSKHGGFNTWNYWNSWKSTFGSDRNGNPAFMRADKFVADPSPECRANPEAGPLGCGQKCVFCMQAGDGSGCPVAPGGPQHNDVSSGIGLSVEFCGGGRAGDCSTGGHWSGHHRTLVWAQFSGT
ncbi:unnamed protein product [Effrenium voratum]|uniref:Uncharacterized protein n=1 Tax=Effrenium voratum TaxID=2562239 RepID=A0AA36IVV9_9DINO|nr:unnamed protein product [Effrenium voratum]